MDFTNGSASVKYYDLRSAYCFRAAEIVFHKQHCFVAFAKADELFDKRAPPNNGTIVVFRLKPKLTDETIEKVFNEFGDIREIRDCPGKPTQRFIEFWDLRAAEIAADPTTRPGLSALGQKIDIQFSRPGGYRASVNGLERNSVPIIQRRSPCSGLTFSKKLEKQAEPALQPLDNSPDFTPIDV
jgi:RNA recognition motif-containing protein